MKVRDDLVVSRVKKEAAQLIAQYGGKGWTMATLAARAGMAKDTLYRIFPAKELMIREIIVDGITDYQGRVDQLAGENRPYEDLLNEMITEFAEFAGRLSQDNMRAIFLEYPAIEAEITRASNDYYQAITAFFDQGKKIGFFREDLDIVLLIRMINAYTLDTLKHQDQGAVAADLKQVIAYLMDGVKAAPE